MQAGAVIFFLLITFLFLIAAILAVRFYLRSLVDRRIAAYQSDLMEKHCAEVEHMYRQTRGWRHDYRNHIQTMKAHLDKGELKELAQYLEDLNVDLTTVDTVIKTGNVMMDAILNSKLSLAKSRHIAVNAKAVTPASLAVSEVDLCIILGNLLDNAMEACLKVNPEEKRFIRVYIDIMKGQLYIYVMNSIADSPKRFGKIYLTGKDSKRHGFGLLRIDKVVEKYHGYLERQDEEGVFATEILLPLSEEPTPPAPAGNP